MLPEIIGSIYVCVVLFVSVSFTVATFSIFVLSSKSFTLTLNSTFFVSLAFKSTEIPLAKLSAFKSVLSSFPTFMLPSINVVPVGIVSITFTVVGAVPILLSSVIV